MSRIDWDQAGSKTYEVGADHGVLYNYYAGTYTGGAAWNGLRSVSCEEDDREVTPLYSGDIKSDVIFGAGGCSGTIEAYTYPDEFEKCIGSTEAINGLYVQQQGHEPFGMSYRSFVGNDTAGQEHAYKLHLIYGAVITNTSTEHSSLSDSPEVVDFSWDYETLPQENEDYQPFSELIIDSRKISPKSMAQLEAILYGSETETPRLPTLDELIELFQAVDTTIPPEYVDYPSENLYPSTTIYPAAQQTP